MNNKPFFPDITGAAGKAVDITCVDYWVLDKRIRQCYWRWGRSEGDNEKPSRRHFRRPSRPRPIV